MSTIWKGITNGGANRFFETGSGDDKVLKVAGADVGGRPVVTKELILDLWEPLETSDTSFNVTSDNAQIILVNDGTSVQIGPGGVGGKGTIDFSSQKAAEAFKAFLEDLGDAGYLADIM